MQFDTDMQSQHSELFLQARAIILSFPNVEEIKKARITTYFHGNSGICHMRTMPHGIDVGFLKGASLEGNYGELVGAGKKMRVLPITKLDKSKLHYYIAQAIKLVT